ncbi:MAG: A24 family peptidase [Candidatus Eremiobacteraeota bacterium]|nr:A24 family peptidase [Candidatus Eremiobacteraeota bacterium]
MNFAILVACVACAAAVVTDIRTRRIPNALTLPLIPIALAFAIRGGFASFAQAALIVAAFLALGTALHRTGWLGGGDIKLGIGIAALLGYPSCVAFILYSGVAGGVLAISIALAQGRFALLRGQLVSAAYSALARTNTVAPVASAPADQRIPYAIALAAGLAAALLLPYYFPTLRFAL